MSASALEDNLDFLDEAADKILAAMESQRTGTVTAADSFAASVATSGRSASPFRGKSSCHQAVKSAVAATSAVAANSFSTDASRRVKQNKSAVPLYEIPPTDYSDSDAAADIGNSGNRNNSSLNNLEKKFDLLMKKHRFVEDRLKKIEKDNSSNCEAARQAQEAAEKLMDAQQVDKKLIYSLRAQLSAVKSRVDVVCSSELLRAKLSAGVSEGNSLLVATGAETNSEMETTSAWKETIQRTVRFEIGKLREELIAKCANEQLKVCAQFHDNNENRIFNRSAGVDQMSSLQQEQVRLAAEIDRMKLRQSQQDTALHALKDSAAVRNAKADAVRKKALQSQRAEAESFISSAQRRVKDALLELQRDAAGCQLLQQELSGFVQRSGAVFAEHEARFRRHDQSKEELYSELERLVLLTDALKQRCDGNDSTVQALMRQSTDAEKTSKLLQLQAQKLDAVDEKLSALDEECKIAVAAVEASNSSSNAPLDALAQCVDDLRAEFSARSDALQSQLQQSTTELTDATKKNKSRLKDLLESVKGVANIRQSVEEVLAEVDSRSQQDAQWAYKLHAGMQQQQIAFDQLLSEFDAVKMQCSDKALVADVQQVQQLLESAIASSEQRFRSEATIENSKQSELMTALLDTQMTQLQQNLQQQVEKLQQEEQQRLQQHHEIVTENFGRVNDALTELQALQDQLIAEHEESSGYHRQQLEALKAATDSRLKATEAAVNAAREGQLQQLQQVQEELSEEVRRVDSKLEDQISVNNEAVERMENSSVEQNSVKEEVKHTMEAQLRSVHKQLQQLQEAQQAAVVASESQQLLLTALQGEQQQYVEKVQSLQQQLVELQLSISSAADAVAADLNSSHQQTAADIEGLQGTLEALTEKLDTTLADIAATNNNYQQQQQELIPASAAAEEQVAVRDALAAVSQDLLQLMQDVDTRLRADIEEDRSVVRSLEEQLATQDTAVREQIAAHARKLAAQEAHFKQRLEATDERLQAVEAANNSTVDGVEQQLQNQQEQQRLLLNEALQHQQDQLTSALEDATSKSSIIIADSQQAIQKLQECVEEKLRDAATAADLKVLELSLGSFSGESINQMNDLQSQLAAIESALETERGVAARRAVDLRAEFKSIAQSTAQELLPAEREKTNAALSRQLEAWSAQLEEVTNEIAERVQQLESSDKRLRDMQQQHVSATAAIRQVLEQVQQQLKQLQQQSANSMRSPSTDVNDYRSSSNFQQQLISSVSQFEQQLQQLRAAVESDASRLQQMEQRIGALSSEVKSKLNEFVHGTESLTSKLAMLSSVEERVDDAVNELSALRAEVEHLTQQQSAVVDANAAASGNASSRMSAVEEKMQQLIKELRQEVTAHSGAATATDKLGSNNPQQQMLQQIEQQCTELDRKFTTQLQQLQQALNEQQQQTVDVTQRAAAAEENIVTAITILEELRSRTLAVEQSTALAVDQQQQQQQQEQKQQEQLQSMEESIEQALQQQSVHLKAQLGELQHKLQSLQESDKARGQRCSTLEQRMFHTEAINKEKLSAAAEKLQLLSADVIAVNGELQSLAEVRSRVRDLEEIFAGFEEAKKAADESFDGRLSAIELELSAQQSQPQHDQQQEQQMSRRLDAVNELCESLVQAMGQDMEHLSVRLDSLEASLYADTAAEDATDADAATDRIEAVAKASADDVSDTSPTARTAAAVDEQRKEREENNTSSPSSDSRGSKSSGSRGDDEEEESEVAVYSDDVFARMAISLDDVDAT